MTWKKKVKKVKVYLDTKDIESLPLEEIKAIVRGADDLIMCGGRTLLAKILKGSKEKKILDLKLNESPVHGIFKDIKIDFIKAKIDWVIANGYLRIEYQGRLPFLVYSGKGWELEKDIYTDELLQRINDMLESGDYGYIETFKDRDRKMMLLLLEKIKSSKNSKYLPALQRWKKLDYKKVQIEIDCVIESFLKIVYPSDHDAYLHLLVDR